MTGAAVQHRVLSSPLASLPSVDESDLAERLAASGARVVAAEIERDAALAERVELVADAVEAGWTYRRIASANGISVARVGQIAQSARGRV